MQCQKVKKLIHIKCESSLMGLHIVDEDDSEEEDSKDDYEYQ